MCLDTLGNYLIAKPSYEDWEGFVAFAVLGQGPDGTRASFKAEDDEPSRRELEAMLTPLKLTWLSLEHGRTVARIPSFDEQLDTPPTFAALASTKAGNTSLTSTKADDTSLASQKADAAIVHAPGYAAAVTTADCIPVVIASAAFSRIAVIHAGWRGMAAGVIEECCLGFISSCGEALPKDTRAWIGPAIAGSDYEITDEVRAQLLASPHVCPGHFVPTRKGHCLADLPAMAHAKLVAAGIRPNNIAQHPESTFRNVRYHSARRDGEKAGRMAIVVGIL